MNDLISDAYRAEQRWMHDNKRYGNSGGKWWPDIVRLVGELGALSWLDYGCGTGELVRKVAEYYRSASPLITYSEYDPGVAGKDAPPISTWDLVSCMDTLEHIEPDRLDAVLADLHRLTRRMLFVVISTRPAGKVLPSGRNAHLIIEDSTWWWSRLQPWFVLMREWQVREQEWCALLEPRHGDEAAATGGWA